MLDGVIIGGTLRARMSLSRSAHPSRLGASAVSREVYAPVNEDAYVPLKWIAELLGVESGAIRHWRYRGWINRAGEVQHVRVRGRLYCAADVFAAEADTYLSSQSRRERQPVAA